ncbi:WD40 repeat-like protein [Punctularia strigosozonata HHB-11173 SS5]|uniref:WD40 repeat-like protein n=1 Tax=Punctularia strigosozonata (strain HHB-11173) TaxID=741275 RepID=UPI0004417236|nr:WD40 repeat-like protein [Punctularia strigosozonata HHB-11173 SS5]EIN13388.1 WD40 repeat-like protein [Punctularia strigosozonata HHB-11173 SS5]
MFFCSISGEPPQDPVVSSKSGHVYERRLITKYITDNGTDPITGEKLEEADLITVKANPKTAAPRPPTQTSIPALLHTLQNEWDALVLETFALKQQYNATRQELSYALYAQDAATRVVARLIKERDAAREALANVQASLGVSAPANGASGDVEMSDDGASSAALPAEVVARIDETHQTLSAGRRKRKAPAGYTTPEQVKSFASVHTIPSLHSPSPAGITALAISAANPGQFLTGGNDKTVQLYDRGSDKVLASLKGHTKKVTHVAFREKEGENTLLLSAGADKIAKVWSHDAVSGEYAPRSTIRTHKGELTGLAVHPTKTLLALASLDNTYSLHDLNTLTQVFVCAPVDAALTSLSVHPDGTLLALSTPGGTLHIFDVRTGAIAASLTPPDAPPFAIPSTSFSENGYHLLSPDSSSSVAIWDLRNQSRVHSLQYGDGSHKINKVAYDYSAKMFGVAGGDGVRVYAHKSWEELVHLQEGEDVADFAFGELGREIWGAAGREVRIWGAPS